ncbi:MAG: type IV toxin-antitoxin system AbiEi family antitoxin domain-containing protein, partial [Marmoricola sp.]
MNTSTATRLALQSGVISRRQALAAGLEPHDLRRLVRRREWAAVHPGVYATHTGPLTWVQRAWAAVLLSWPAALCHESALRAGDGPGLRARSREETIHIGVDRGRSMLVVPDGIELHHLTRFEEKVLWNLGPPRLRYEEAALDVAASAQTELDAVAALAKACQSRRTTARRLLTTLDQRPRVRRRDWLRGVLLDVAEGTCSVLEHGYLARIERPHGFPPAQRQVRAEASTGVVYRDAQYRVVLVELDGRLFHDPAEARDRDFERDLD